MLLQSSISSSSQFSWQRALSSCAGFIIAVYFIPVKDSVEGHIYLLSVNLVASNLCMNLPIRVQMKCVLQSIPFALKTTNSVTE